MPLHDLTQLDPLFTTANTRKGGCDTLLSNEDSVPTPFNLNHLTVMVIDLVP